jgi:ABC-type multidrug transport system ATPase subunit
MKIILDNISRRFNQDWIFESINYTFETGQSYSILGPNGSGKSTLLQIIAGSLSASSGTIEYQKDGQSLEIDAIYRQLSLSAPYLELIEEFTLSETIAFHAKFKNMLPGISPAKLIDILGLNSNKHKLIRNFSSGMKQRTKLALAVLSDTPILLLDEPTANLDQQGQDWYQELISSYTKNKLLIIGSNQEHEYRFCNHHIQLSDYKRAQ